MIRHRALLASTKQWSAKLRTNRAFSCPYLLQILVNIAQLSILSLLNISSHHRTSCMHKLANLQRNQSSRNPPIAISMAKVAFQQSPQAQGRWSPITAFLRFPAVLRFRFFLLFAPSIVRIFLSQLLMLGFVWTSRWSVVLPLKRLEIRFLCTLERNQPWNSDQSDRYLTCLKA